MTSPTPLRDATSAVRPPTVLLVTSCPWTTRALDLALGTAGLSLMQLPDLRVAERLCAAGSVDAVLVDERATADPASRGADACRRVGASVDERPALPVMLLARDALTSAEQRALFDAGAWGIAPYPLGGSAWVHQLATWTRASREAHERVHEGLVDLITGLYNARGLARRAEEADATLRRMGGAVACAVFALDGEDGSDAVRVAEACRRAGRASDVFGRISVCEFGVVALGANAKGVRTLVDRIASMLGAADSSLVRVGICAVADARTSTLSVAQMLSYAMGRA